MPSIELLFIRFRAHGTRPLLLQSRIRFGTASIFVQQVVCSANARFCLINNSTMSVMDFRQALFKIDFLHFLLVAFFSLFLSTFLIFILLLLPIDAQLFRSKRIVLRYLLFQVVFIISFEYHSSPCIFSNIVLTFL